MKSPTLGSSSNQAPIDALLDHDVTSFVELAILSPALWQRFSVPEDRRRAAILLGWPTTCATELFEQMALTDFLAIFLNSGIRTVEELWQRHPEDCEYLRRTRCLGTVIRLLALQPTIVAAVQAEEFGFYLSRCRDAGCIDVWRDIDRVAYDQALRLGFLDRIAADVPCRPPAGYPTAGGPVGSTEQLIVARILESTGVRFEVNMCCRAVNRIPGWTVYPIDFVVSKPERYLIITSGMSVEAAHLDRQRGRWLKRLLRTDAKLRRRKLRGGVVLIDGGLLRSAGGLSAFGAHVHLRLSLAGVIPSGLPFDPRQCLRTEAADEPLGHDGRGG